MVHRVASQPSRMEGGGRDQRDWTWRVRTKPSPLLYGREVAIRHRRNTTSKPPPAGPTEQPKRIDEKEDAAASRGRQTTPHACLSPGGALRHFSPPARRSGRPCHRRRPNRLLPLVPRAPRLLLLLPPQSSARGCCRDHGHRRRHGAAAAGRRAARRPCPGDPPPAPRRLSYVSTSFGYCCGSVNSVSGCSR